MKSVCIVGAGPAGLVAAKTLLQTREFEVTIFEKDKSIAGIWSLTKDSTGGFLSPHTPTNLSRFTCSFSDLDWNSVDFGEQSSEQQNGAQHHAKPPMFPAAWMANRYLETYRSRYIPADVIHCNREVTQIERSNDKWTVTTAYKQSAEFDYLIIASGFFARPRHLGWNVPGMFQTSLPVKCMHTSSFRDLEDLVPTKEDLKGKKILILGGGNSSGETAASVALQLSNAQWSPNSPSSKRFKDCKIVHISPRPLYPLPPFVELTDGSFTYVPIDFRLYDFSKRPEGMPSYGGRQPMEVRNIVHGVLQGISGGDLSDVSKALVSHKGDSRGAVYVALAESYAEYVRSGMINVIGGRVTSLVPDQIGSVTAMVKQEDDEFEVEDIGAIIYATGYTPSPALNILDNDTKEAVQYDQESMRLPMILEQWQTMSKDAPTVSFIGFYEGPYWPMMEMQAKLTAERWLSGKTSVQRPYEQKEELLRLRQGMDNRGLDVPQYWFGDYLGYLEDIAKELSLERNDHGFNEREGCISPARYVSKDTNRKEADAIMEELLQIWQACTMNGRFMSRVAFRALHGQWDISRTIESKTSTSPSGTLEGIASFYPRLPTADSSGRDFDLEYLYVEAGTFTLANGAPMNAKRRYVYRYSEADDQLSVWFVKPENDLEVDYLFHKLSFENPEKARAETALVANADHPCANDMYWTEYRLPMKGIALREFSIEHIVKGPNKDYTSTTRYSRPLK